MCRFLAPNFVGGVLPEFLESIYKIDTGSDHVAKFLGDRPRELGDYALKKKKHHEHFIRPPVTPYGRPNDGPIRWWKNFDDTFSRFDTLHACDGQTDRRTDERTDGIGVAYTRYSTYAVARKNQIAISPRRIIRFQFTPCLVLGRDFRGRRIE